KLWDTATGRCKRTLEGDGGSVTSIVFSPDGKQVASASEDKIVKLWDTVTGWCERTFETSLKVHYLSFSSTGSQLYTDVGAFSLGPLTSALSSSIQKALSICFSADKAWIMRNSERLLWLPPEYRPTKSAVMGSSTAIACSSGRVLLLKLS
ncbi:WD40-repeat-containing domain protein, partial [Fusarium oxysporum]